MIKNPILSICCQFDILNYASVNTNYYTAIFFKYIIILLNTFQVKCTIFVMVLVSYKCTNCSNLVGNKAAEPEKDNLYHKTYVFLGVQQNINFQNQPQDYHTRFTWPWDNVDVTFEQYLSKAQSHSLCQSTFITTYVAIVCHFGRCS